MEFKFRITSDSDYQILVVFDKGESLKRTVGYVMPGIRFQDVVTVSDKDIILENKPLNKPWGWFKEEERKRSGEKKRFH